MLARWSVASTVVPGERTSPLPSRMGSTGLMLLGLPGSVGEGEIMAVEGVGGRSAFLLALLIVLESVSLLRMPLQILVV